jgi:uncharacterized protein YjiS (DUF1127 family)
MSVYKHPSSTVRQSPFRRRAPTALARQLLRATRRWQRSRAIAAFQALPDMYLQGIGMTRSDIPKMARDLFPGGSRFARSEPPRARLRSELRNAP